MNKEVRLHESPVRVFVDQGRTGIPLIPSTIQYSTTPKWEYALHVPHVAASGISVCTSAFAMCTVLLSDSLLTGLMWRSDVPLTAVQDPTGFVREGSKPLTMDSSEEVTVIKLEPPK